MASRTQRPHPLLAPQLREVDGGDGGDDGEVVEMSYYTVHGTSGRVAGWNLSSPTQKK